MLTKERTTLNHHLQGDNDEFTVATHGQPLSPDKMKELREAAKLLAQKE